MYKIKYLKFGALLLHLIIGSTGLFYAQSSYQAYRYTLKDGLSSELCRKIYKDKAGFVWISSNKGLNRYDGNSLYVFKHDHKDNTSLASNRCNVIFEDSQNRLWISTDEGISYFDRQKQNFVNYYPHITGHNSNIGYTGLAEDHLHRIWVGGQYDVLIFDPETKTFSKSGWYKFALNSGIISEVMRNSISQSIIRKSKDQLWILTVYGLFSVHTPSMKFSYHPNPKVKDYFAFEIAWVEPTGKLWISTFDQCFYSYDPSTDLWHHHPCPQASNRVLNIFQSDENKLLIAFPHGIMEYDPRTFRFLPYHLPLEEMNSSNQLANVLKSDDQMYVLQTGNFPWVHFIPERASVSLKKLTLPQGIVNHQSYITNSKHYLIGDWDKKIVLWCTDQSCVKLKDQFGDEILGPLQLFYLAKNGQQYFSTSNGCFLLNENEHVVHRITSLEQDKSKSKTEFRNFVEDQDGNIYIRERNTGLYILKKGSSKAEILPLGISGNSFGALYYEKATSRLWLCNDKDGLYIVDPKSGKHKNYPLSVFACPRSGYINDILGDTLGHVYLLINGCGLVKINSKTMKSKLYTTADGMLSEGVSNAIIDDKDYLWISSESGLMAFNRVTQRFFIFDGDQAKRFTYRLFKDDKGNIAQNSLGEILVFDRSALDKELDTKSLYLKELQVFGIKKAVDSIMIFDHHDNNISLYYGYLGDKKIPSREFQYRINGDTWQSVPNMALHLFNMSPGRFHIDFRYQYEPQQVLTTHILILSPWWKTWWFYCLLGSFVAMSSYLLYRRRIQIIVKAEAEKNLLKQQIAENEMSALRAQMNPHFIFNCLNSINRFILVNNTIAASDYLTKFSRLIRMILDGSKADFTTLENELIAIKLYIEMESMRFGDSFEWEIRVDKEIRTDSIMIPPLLLQPYVENAIWHGLMQAPVDAKKKLKVHIYQKTENIAIEILDNGIGRDKALKLKSKSGSTYKSHGITLSAERLQIMEKLQFIQSKIIFDDLRDENGNPLGTKVTITIKPS